MNVWVNEYGNGQYWPSFHAWLHLKSCTNTPMMGVFVQLLRCATFLLHTSCDGPSQEVCNSMCRQGHTLTSWMMRNLLFSETFTSVLYSIWTCYITGPHYMAPVYQQCCSPAYSLLFFYHTSANHLSTSCHLISFLLSLHSSVHSTHPISTPLTLHAPPLLPLHPTSLT